MNLFYSSVNYIKNIMIFLFYITFTIISNFVQLFTLNTIQKFKKKNKFINLPKFIIVVIQGQVNQDHNLEYNLLVLSNNKNNTDLVLKYFI